MGDIHIGKSSTSGKGGDSGTVQVFYHVPNNLELNAYPGVPDDSNTTAAQGVEQAEKDQLVAGTLVEVPVSMQISHNESLANTRDRIRADWQTIATRTQAKLNKQYKFFGLILARA